METSDTSDFIRRGLSSPLLIPTVLSGSPSSTTSLSSAEVPDSSVHSDMTDSEWDGSDNPPGIHVTSFQIPLVLEPWQVVECETMIHRYLYETFRGTWVCTWEYSGMDTECQVEWSEPPSGKVEAALSEIIHSFFPTDIVITHIAPQPSDSGHTSDTGSNLDSGGTPSDGYVSANFQSIMSVDSSEDSGADLSGESEDEVDDCDSGGELSENGM